MVDGIDIVVGECNRELLDAGRQKIISGGRGGQKGKLFGDAIIERRG